jgi:hypothetical protein
MRVAVRHLTQVILLIIVIVGISAVVAARMTALVALSDRLMA